MKPKIIFFGTPNFAVEVLKEIHNGEFEIQAVITSPDKKSGRGRKVNSSPVKKFCLGKKIKLYQPTNLKEKSFISILKSYKSDLYIVVAFRMIPETVWSIPKIGTFNLHASLLPEYRGAAPINWVLINQESFTGLTTFMIDNKIDTGKILLQSKYKIKDGETYDTLHDNLLDIGKKLVLDTIQILYQKNFRSIEQINNPKNRIAPKLTKSNTKIRWNNSLKEIVAFINGLNSYPGAWSFISQNDKKGTFKIYESDYEYTSHKFTNNKLLSYKKTLKIAHQEGFLIIKNLKISNKKRMNTNELLNGHTFESEVFVS